jgi:uncharacterized membrane protein
MQKERDSLDQTIFESTPFIELSDGYDERLVAKLHKTGEIKFGKDKSAALSFIMAGLLSIIMYTTDIQFKIVDFQYKVRNQILTLEYNYNIDMQRYFIGE